MKQKWLQFYRACTDLSPWQRIAVLLSFLAVLSCAVVLLAVPSLSHLTWLAYIMYALSAFFLGWATMVVVRYAPKLRRDIIAFLEKFAFTRRLLVSYGFRTLMFSILAFFLGIAVAVFNGVLAVLGGSIWYGSLALFYLTISCLRGGILIYHSLRKNRRLDGETQREDRLRRVRLFRSCGICLIVITLALSVSVLQMSFAEKAFHYAGLTIYAFAAYACYKMSMSLFHLFRARHHHDLTVRAIRNVNLTDAMVSVLALQTALLQAFNDGVTPAPLYNLLTGFFVVAATMAIGITMIVVAAKHKKRLLSESDYTKEQI